MLGSGIAETCRFRFPEVVPADARVICMPIVSEYGLTTEANALVALPANVGPVRPASELMRLAPENCSAVLLVPPQARPVTVPLAPELVPPRVSSADPE